MPNTSTHDIKALGSRIEHLCARCDALAREVRLLRDENRKLRDNNARARKKINDIMLRLPESL
ncbi:hypothetical protein NQX30_01535 [Candidatus Persebacteraceae bacterium Df01]|jgi:outer membrane murein-binding lipoprotein Lpp|uniref:Cell division protein ZapB n=1 Tax=Candidatus Doriopsillibacter californiensis TaxID=2970740 RepID=A0ABT7QKC0_9GAMM|nr:hypothetical protein [Candidatus Persebacteraceae bacterium Df01]